MVPGLVFVAALLAARPEVHGAAELGSGVGAPLSTANTSAQFSLRAHVELSLTERLAVGVIAHVALGFYNARSAPVPISYQLVDLMPGPRGKVTITDWFNVALELGIGPTILGVETFIPGYGTANDTHPVLGARAALELEFAPAVLKGFMLYLEPVAIQARFSEQAFSEVRCSAGFGYRR